jgi:hypothetical protein
MMSCSRLLTADFELSIQDIEDWSDSKDIDREVRPWLKLTIFLHGEQHLL